MSIQPTSPAPAPDPLAPSPATVPAAPTAAPPAPAAEAVVVVDGLSHRYSDGHQALWKASFRVCKGEIHGFVGPNGAGKTTTLKVLATLLKPQMGTVRVFGANVRTNVRGVRRSVGWMPDYFGLYRRMTVREYLDFFAAAYGLRGSKRRTTVDDVLTLTDMAGRAGTMLDGLSRGMQQRVSLARLLVHDPKLLLLDEPASGLDPRARIDLMEILKTLARQLEKTIFISSHILSELQDLCDSATIIDRGTVRFSGSFDELGQTSGDERFRLTLAAPSASLAQRLADGVEGLSLLEEPGEDPTVFEVGVDRTTTTPAVLLNLALGQQAEVVELTRLGRQLDQAFLELTTPGVGDSA